MNTRLSSGESGTIAMMRDSVRRFAQAELAPRVEEHDRDDRFHRYLWPKLGEMGLMGIMVPESEGGLGLGYPEHVVVLEELARICAAAAMSYGVHSSLVIDQLMRHASSDQRRRLLPGLLSGELVAAIAMTEAEAGSDLVGMRTRAHREGDRWLVNGSKLWITNAAEADVVLVYAKTDPAAGKRGITAFLAEKSQGGLHVNRKLDLWGMRGSGSAELVFEDCEVPPENVLGGVNEGVRVLMSGLDYERVIAAAQCVGIMQAALDLTLPYVRERRQFGQPIGEFQLMQGKIADMYTQTSAARAYVQLAAAAAQNGSLTRHDAAAAYLFAAEIATQVALQAMQALGANGYSNENSAQRLVRDAKLFEIGGGTAEVRRMLIGRELFTKGE